MPHLCSGVLTALHCACLLVESMGLAALSRSTDLTELEIRICPFKICPKYAHLKTKKKLKSFLEEVAHIL